MRYGFKVKGNWTNKTVSENVSGYINIIDNYTSKHHLNLKITMLLEQYLIIIKLTETASTGPTLYME